jgi:hypothetical protein
MGLILWWCTFIFLVNWIGATADVWARHVIPFLLFFPNPSERPWRERDAATGPVGDELIAPPLAFFLSAIAGGRPRLPEHPRFLAAGVGSASSSLGSGLDGRIPGGGALEAAATARGATLTGASPAAARSRRLPRLAAWRRCKGRR